MSNQVIIPNGIAEKLQESFRRVVEPLQVTYFVSTNNLLTFDCILSSSKLSEIGESRSVYEIPSLLRLLCLEDKVVDIPNATILFNEAENTICRILEWSNYIKRIVIFDLNGVSTFNEEKFIHLTSVDTDILNKSFCASYNAYCDLGVIK